tara:strand:+ start:1137 stop:1448 length:312 start_codon:yes stop_codon:yes gene_type:complete
MPTLITKTNSQRIAEEIDSAQQELLNHVEATLSTIYSKVNTDGEQQAILDAFGANAASAISAYAAMFQSVAAINPATNVPVPDLAMFRPQPDGTVNFSPPSPI